MLIIKCIQAVSAYSRRSAVKSLRLWFSITVCGFQWIVIHYYLGPITTCNNNGNTSRMKRVPWLALVPASSFHSHRPQHLHVVSQILILLAWSFLAQIRRQLRPRSPGHQYSSTVETARAEQTRCSHLQDMYSMEGITATGLLTCTFVYILENGLFMSTSQSIRVKRHGSHFLRSNGSSVDVILNWRH